MTLKERYEAYKNSKVTTWYGKLIYGLVFSKLYKLVASAILLILFAGPAQSDNPNISNIFEIIGLS